MKSISQGTAKASLLFNIILITLVVVVGIDDLSRKKQAENAATFALQMWQEAKIQSYNSKIQASYKKELKRRLANTTSADQMMELKSRIAEHEEMLRQYLDEAQTNLERARQEADDARRKALSDQ